MKRVLAVVISLMMCQFAFAQATITVTVSVAESIGVSVDTATWAIGAVTIGGSASAPFTVVATNDGNVAEDFSIEADGVPTNGWNIGAAAGADTFAVQVTPPVIAAFQLTDTATLFADEVPFSGTDTASFDLSYTPPTSDTIGAGSHDFSIVVTASAD